MSKIGSRKLFPDLDGGIIWSHDGAWFDQFKLLAARSKFVVMVPIVLPSKSATTEPPGTLKEIEYLVKTGLIEKTVFVVPPRTRVLLSLERRQGLLPSVPTLWETSRQLLKEQKLLDLPSYPGGHSLLFPDRGGWVFVASVSGRPWNAYRALRHIFINQRVADTPSKDACGIATRLALLCLPLWLFLVVLIAVFGIPYLASISLDSPAGRTLETIQVSTGGTYFGYLLVFAPLLLPLMMYLKYASFFHLRSHGVLVLQISTVTAMLASYFAWLSVSGPINELYKDAAAHWKDIFTIVRIILFFASIWAAVWLVAWWVFSTYRSDFSPWQNVTRDRASTVDLP